jgi:hypothetical protein
VFFLLLCISACAPKIYTLDVHSQNVGGPEPIAPEEPIYLALGLAPDSLPPEDLTRILNKVETAFKHALGAHAKQVTVAQATSELNQALEAARVNGASYLVYPKIIHWDEPVDWEDRLRAYSIAVMILDVRSGQTIDDVVISGRLDTQEKPFIPNGISLRHPVHLYVAGLYFKE